MVMGRHKRKRSSKAANPPGIAVIANEPVSRFAISTDVENLAPSLDISSDAKLTSSPMIPDKEVDLTNSLSSLTASPAIAKHEKSAASPSAAPSGADRRTHPRYEFTAAVEVVAPDSGARVETRVRDLSRQGCYVDTSEALPLGTITDVCITKGAQRFRAAARVVYSRASKGMGLMFTRVEPEPLRILEAWLDESRETSWLAENRRRSQRVLVAVPVRVSGHIGAGLPFEEDTHTRAISAHGALLLLSSQVHRGQRLTLSNVQTKAALDCVVAHVDRRRNSPQVGVEFLLPNPLFWHVAFPPRDWTPRHPDAKSHTKAPKSNARS